MKNIFFFELYGTELHLCSVDFIYDPNDDAPFRGKDFNSAFKLKAEYLTDTSYNNFITFKWSDIVDYRGLNLLGGLKFRPHETMGIALSISRVQFFNTHVLNLGNSSFDFPQ